jgi:hypothetical protein
MLKRFTCRLIILAVMVTALAPLSSSSTTPNRTTSTRMFCDYAVDEYGNCVAICCDKDGGCMSYPCS